MGYGYLFTLCSFNGFNFYNMSLEEELFFGKNQVEVLRPMTDEEKELYFGIKIYYLHLNQIMEQFGHLLTEKQKEILKNDKKDNLSLG